MIVSESITKQRALKQIRRNWQGSVSASTSYLTWISTKEGSTVPGYKKKIAAVTSATSPYSRKDTTIDQGYFRGIVSWVRLGVVVTEDLYDETKVNQLPTQTPVNTSKVYNTALGNFLANANEVVSPFKGMTFLAELRETLKMLRNPASALRDGFSAYLKRAHDIRRRLGHPPGGNRHSIANWRRKAKEANKVLANSWLEYCYGWRPLMADVASACNAYSTFQSKVDTLRVYGKSEDRSNGSTTTVNSILVTNAFMSIITTKKYSGTKCVFRGVVKNSYRGVDTTTANEIIRLSGFRLEEFIPTVWELIPYSFVVDYFSNIGDILNGMHALSMDFAWLSASTKVTNVCESNQRLDEAYARAGLKTSFVSASHTSRPGKVTTTFYTRVNPVLGLPSLQLELPSSNWQWSGLAALIASKWR